MANDPSIIIPSDNDSDYEEGIRKHAGPCKRVKKSIRYQLIDKIIAYDKGAHCEFCLFVFSQLTYSVLMNLSSLFLFSVR